MNLLTDFLEKTGTKAEFWYLMRLQSLEEREIKQCFELGLVNASMGDTKDIEVWNVENELVLVGAGSETPKS